MSGRGGLGRHTAQLPNTAPIPTLSFSLSGSFWPCPSVLLSLVCCLSFRLCPAVCLLFSSFLSVFTHLSSSACVYLSISICLII